MSDVEMIKERLDESIDFDNLIQRLKLDLDIEEQTLYSIILDVIIIILDYTNQNKICLGLRTTLINMIREYASNSQNDNEVKAVTIGDIKTEYNVVGADKNVLIEKYSNALNRYRKLRW